MMLLRANTAVDVLIGPFVDSGDGVAAETGLTISQADVLLSKNGQALTQKNDDTAAAHDANGYYNCELNATDTNTEGQLFLAVSESGALPVWHEYNVLSEAAWDSLFAAKDDGFMDVNIKTIGRTDTTETEANNLESACANYSATRGLAGTALPAAAAGGSTGLPIYTDIAAILEDSGLVLVTTTIASYSSQTSFTLTAGSTDDNAYTDCTIVIEDSATAADKSVSPISAYTGATRTVTLPADPGEFTFDTGDKVRILPFTIKVANACADANLERIHDDALNAAKPFDTT